jgi:catalase
MGYIKRKYDEFVLWIVSVSFVCVVAAYFGFGKRQRMSHNKGVGGRGSLKIVDHPNFPDHDFFVPGSVFACRIRHASVTFSDDAMNQVRGVSLKFADSNFKSPLDLEMNSGPISIFWTAANFWKFVLNRNEKGGIQYKEYYVKEPDGFKGAQVSGKHKPSSFATLSYYSKTPMRFRDKSGVDYYVKYRLIPGQDAIEEAAIPEDQKIKVYDQRVAEGEKLPVNYLVNEYKERLTKGLILYKLQLQLHQAQPGDPDSIFDSRLPWDESEHPYHDVAEVTIKQLLSYEEMVKMGVNIKHQPKSLGIIKAKSIHDFNSVAYMRTKTNMAYYARQFMYKIKGIPKETADDAPRNR